MLVYLSFIGNFSFISLFIYHGTFIIKKDTKFWILGGENNKFFTIYEHFQKYDLSWKVYMNVNTTDLNT